MEIHKGSCLCGSVTYSFAGGVDEYGYCHCSDCRKASGSAHSANARVSEDVFKLEDSHGCLKSYQSSPGTLRFFCSCCGSPVFSRVEKTPGFIRLRLGSLDTPLTKKPSRHTFVASKASWHDIEGDLPKFPERAE